MCSRKSVAVHPATFEGSLRFGLLLLVVESRDAHRLRLRQDAAVGLARRFLRTLFLPFFTMSGSVFLTFTFLRADLSFTLAGMRADGSRSRWRLGFSASSDMFHTDRTCKPSIIHHKSSCASTAFGSSFFFCRGPLELPVIPALPPRPRRKGSGSSCGRRKQLGIVSRSLLLAACFRK